VIDDDPHGKWSKPEGEILANLLREHVREGGTMEQIFLISPFRDVASGVYRTLREIASDIGLSGRALDRYIASRAGTVHTAQGKESDGLIFILGAQGKLQRGARRWASGQPNILNVAASRARRNLVVIGSKQDWGDMGAFRIMTNVMREAESELTRGEISQVDAAVPSLDEDEKKSGFLRMTGS
jgi:hypothetical protein